MKKKSMSGSALGVVALALVVAWGPLATSAMAQQTPQVPLAGSAIPKFVDALPALNIVMPGTTPLAIDMREFQFPILPAGAVPGYTGTWVWGYVPQGQIGYTSYIGPVVLAQRGQATTLKFVNNLGTGAGTNVLAYKYSVDQTLHWADPLHDEANPYSGAVPAFNSPGSLSYTGPIPAVVHLHGGEVPPELDGGPDAWLTSDGGKWGHGFWTLGNTQQGTNVNAGTTDFNSFTYKYPNTQEASNIWFHDHTLGATRLNVYAGLAGGYLISDPNLILPDGLTAHGIGTETIIPLVIQDRMFDTNGQLFFPADSAAGVLWTPNPDHPYWVPEFVGDTIVVNGKTWPIKNLEPKRYRFLFLNGSNARTYELFLVNPVTKLNGPPMWVIGTDGGYLDTPVKIDPNAAANNKLVIMPGERYDVIIDFAGFANSQLIMRNTARTPYPKGGTPNGATTGQIIKFIISPNPVADTGYDPAMGGALRTTAIVRLANPATGGLAAGVTPALTRALTLNEVMGLPQLAIDPVTGLMTAYPGGPLEVLLNNTKWTGRNLAGAPVSGGVPYPTDTGGRGEIFYTERPNEGVTEVWEIINITADAHPIHLHLVQFQLMNRQNFNFNKYMKAYAAAFLGGLVLEANGPPLGYGPTPATGNKYGGNPDVTPWLQGPLLLPSPQEAGWKDTVVALPGQVTRLVVRWAPTDIAVGDTTNSFFPFDPDGGHGYVWHCHIIDHEDNEMMRPTQIQPKAVIRPVTNY